MAAFIQEIEDFVEGCGITGTPREIPNTDKLHPKEAGNRCYQTTLTRGEVSETVLTYTGEGWHSQDISGVLHDMMFDAEDYQGWETYELWDKNVGQNFGWGLDEEYARLYYEYCKAHWYVLRRFLSEEEYEELVRLIPGM